MLRRWFKMGGKNPLHWSPFPLFILVNLLEEAHAFLKPWSPDIHTLHLLPYYFSILNVQELYHKQPCWIHVFLISLTARMLCLTSPGSPPCLPGVPFYWSLRVPFLLCLLFLHVFTLFLIDPLAHTRAFSNHINTSSSNTCLSHRSYCTFLHQTSLLHVPWLCQV